MMKLRAKSLRHTRVFQVPYGHASGSLHDSKHIFQPGQAQELKPVVLLLNEWGIKTFVQMME